MAVAHKGAISFGLVYIPISLYTATQEAGIKFNQLHKESGQRVRYKKVVPGVDEDVAPGEIIKGYEFAKDKYVTVSEEDFEKIKTAKDKAIHIISFTDKALVDPIYFDKSYYAVPDSGGEKAFELLRVAMLKENKVGVAKTVLGTKETLMMLIPNDDGIVTETLFYQSEIKAIPKAYTKTEVTQEELNMAKMLIDSMAKRFDPTEYKDEYQQKLQAMLEQKINGQEITTVTEKAPSNVINLMDALKASIEQAKKQPESTKKAL